MGRITLGDIGISAIITLVLVLIIAVAAAMATSVMLGLSDDASYQTFIGTLLAVFIGGGLVLGSKGHAAGYPVLRIWAFSAGLFLLVFYLPYFVLSFASGKGVSVEILMWMTIYIGILFLGLFFVVALAGFLNSREFALPQPRTFGSRPGQFGASIYKSNQPAIYEGIMDIDASDEAPGSLYRRRQ